MCPICHKNELWRRSGDIAKKLAFVKKEYYKQGIESEYVEVIYYPPKDKRQWAYYTTEGQEWLSAQLTHINRDFGVLGGVRVVHITAVNREDGSSYKEYDKLKATGHSDQIRWNPHIQAVALRRSDWGPTRAKEKKWQDRGWFVRVLYADGRTGNKRWGNVRNKISYELGHAYQGKTEDGFTKTLTVHFGICAYNNVRQKVTIRLEKELCKCGSTCSLFEDGVRKDVAMLKIRSIEFWLTDKAINRAVLIYELTRGAGRSEKLDMENYGELTA